METLVTIMAIAASISILAGYLRLITDDNGNIPLLSYRLSGCLGAFLYGMVVGTKDLVTRKITDDALSAIMVYIGLGIFFLIFSRGN